MSTLRTLATEFLDGARSAGRTLWAALRRAWTAFVRWIGPAADSIKGQVNAEELKRAVIKALSSGSLTSLSFDKLTSDSDVVIVVAGVIVGLLVFVLDTARRRNHGEEPTP